MSEEEATSVVADLYESWYSTLLSYARRRTGNRSLAEDLVQEAFLALYGELRFGDGVENLKGWTVTVVRRSIHRSFEEARRHVSAGDLLEDVEGIAPTHLRPNWVHGVDLERALTKLSKREEEVVYLRLAAMKYCEIAEMLSITPGSVCALLSRAVKKLRAALNADSVDSSGQENVTPNLYKSLQ